MSNIVISVGVHVKLAKLGRVYAGEVGVRLGSNPDTVVGADALFLTNAQLPPRLSPEGWLLTMPALVVEVKSKNDCQPQIDRTVKRYLDAGVDVVWVVDPAERRACIHTPGSVTAVGEAEVLEGGGLLPGLAVPVAELFE